MLSIVFRFIWFTSKDCKMYFSVHNLNANIILFRKKQSRLLNLLGDVIHPQQLFHSESKFNTVKFCFKNMMIISKRKKLEWCVPVSGGSRISHRRGGVDLVRGVDYWGSYVLKILYVKNSLELDGRSMLFCMLFSSLCHD